MRIFVSSTFRDLRPEREAAVRVLRRAQFIPWGMELFISEPSTPLEVALRELQLSDAVVLLIGFRAGSLVPDAPELTYTAAEIRRAHELGRPIFVFIQTECGIEHNKETTASLRVALDDFKRFIFDAGLTPAYFENSDRLEVELLLAMEKWNSEGRPGARLTFTTAREFYAPYRTPMPRLFDFKQTLRGRDSELNTLDTFLCTPVLVVGVLTGRGGIGKSKLVHDWVETLTTAEALYVREDSCWHPEAAKEIPSGNIVIVADDAHRFDFLDKLLILVQNLSQHQNIKLLLTTRPSGTSQIDAALAIRFDSTQVKRFPALERVGNQSVIAIAEETLGPRHIQFARSLAGVSADTPLVTVVGGRLIARGDIAPSLLANEDDFRHQVFDRFSTEYERLLPPCAVDWRKLLNLIAAAGPLPPTANSFVEPAAQILRLRSDEIIDAIDLLERHGLLLRGGRVVRIVPDLLSDFLLEGACITRSGDSTGFADLVFKSFQTDHLSNVLRNLGELDWRITQRNQDQGTRLLDRIWTEIEQSFDAADAGGRVDLLKALNDAALFQPARVMRLIQRAMSTEATPVELFPGWKVTQENVTREIPSLLRSIALHLEFLNASVLTLWHLAQRDSRIPNQYPDHARRVLEDLAEYGRYKPVVFNERMAEVAETLSQLDGAFNGKFTPLSISDKLLAKEGQFTESEGLTLSIGGFALNYPLVKPVREKSIALIESCLNSENTKIALIAISSLSHILGGFLPMVVRQPSESEHRWQDTEREIALGIIQNRLMRPTPIPVIRQLRSTLRQVRPRILESPIGQHIDAILASIPQSDDLTIFDAFCTGEWDCDAQFNTIEEADQARENLVARGAELFRRLNAGAQAQVHALVRLVDEAESCGLDVGSKPYNFIDKICVDEFLDKFLDYLLDDPHPLLAQLIAIPLRRLRTSEPDRYLDIGLKASTHENFFISYGAANAVCYGSGLNTPIRADLAILQSLAHHPSERVRHLTFTGVRRLGTHLEYSRNAIDLLLSTEIGDSEQMADEMCSTMHYSGISLNKLLDRDVREILQKLVPTTEVNDHNITFFLDWAGKNHADMLIEYILKRLDRHANIANRDSAYVGYAPVPHHQFGTAFHALQTSPQYGTFLAQIRDRFIRQPEQRYWLRELFWSVGTVDATTFGAIDELVHLGDREHALIAIELFGGGPPGIALSHPYFAIHLIQECDRLDLALGERMASALITNAHIGSFQRIPGQPSPKFLAMKSRAAMIRDIFVSGSSSHGFFGRLHDSAVSVLERERLDDEELTYN